MIHEQSGHGKCVHAYAASPLKPNRREEHIHTHVQAACAKELNIKTCNHEHQRWWWGGGGWGVRGGWAERDAKAIMTLVWLRLCSEEHRMCYVWSTSASCSSFFNKASQYLPWDTFYMHVLNKNVSLQKPDCCILRHMKKGLITKLDFCVH